MTEAKQPGERYWSLVETVWDSISIYDGGDEFIRQFQAVEMAAGLLFAAH